MARAIEPAEMTIILSQRDAIPPVQKRLMPSFLDFALLLLILYFVIRGVQEGFVSGILRLVAWIVSFLVALRFYATVAPHLSSLLRIEPAIATPLAFLTILMGAGIALSGLATGIIARIPARVRLGRGNRWLGLIPGGLIGLLWAAVFSSLLLSLPLSGQPLSLTRDSRLLAPLAHTTDRLQNRLRPVFGQAIEATARLVTPKPTGGETVLLPTTVQGAQPRLDLEARMLMLVNQERESAGLSLLVMDDELVAVARAHSADMLARGYFSHLTPEGLTPFDRLTQAGVGYVTAGENLAYAPTLTIAHRGLMESPGHRENILRPEFGRVGIGILDGGTHGLMVTQLFREPAP